MVLKAMMEFMSIKAEEANSGQECLDKLERARPCMCPFYKYLFLDLNMPGLSGIDVIREIKERAKKMDIYANLKIFLVTGGGLTSFEEKEIESFKINDICKH